MDAKPAPRGGLTAPRSVRDLLNNEGVRGILYQILVFGLVALGAWYLVGNTLENLERQQIATGYGYLELEASFGISETPIAYDPSDTYSRALLVGVVNTVKVSVLGIILATILGILFGIGRLSTNWLVRVLSTIYVDAFRNIPVLIQLIFWYSVINNVFPGPRNAMNPIGDVFLTNRGIFVPMLAGHPAYAYAAVAALIGLGGAFYLRRWAVKRQEATGQPFPVLSASIAMIIVCAVLGWAVGGAPTEISVPALKGFNFDGGWRMTPEFAAVLIGLTVYTSTFIAEVVRSGIQAVPKGQWEAADSLGLRRSYVMRLVILPQSMRVAIPPLTNQYLNLTKNSSLAVAVGYPDLVSISNTTLNQTGQAIEAISIFMSIYLGLSILTSVFMNWFNKKMALVER
ncbi:MAG: amino acid ABC transporter permease [Magnetospiraceae bacterium]